MEDIFKGSPYRRHTDEEVGGSHCGFGSDDEGPFSITRTKDAPVDRLRRWRVFCFSFFFQLNLHFYFWTYRIWCIIGVYIFGFQLGIVASFFFFFKLLQFFLSRNSSNY